LILPIWYAITKEEVEKFSPLLVGKIAAHANSKRDIPKIVKQLVEVLSVTT